MFDKKLYTQIDGLAIGAATSGFAANLFMERLEQRALSTFANPPSTWFRYVDDTFSKVKKDQIDLFLAHLNNQHPRIKFTTEMEKEGKIAFLDTLVQRKEDGTIKISIYRKSTHTDQYLDWRSNHHISQKTGIIRTFKHRIETLVTDEQDKISELKHVKKALKRCGHPDWTMNNKKRKPPKEQNNDAISKVSIPYVKGTSERISKVFKKYKIGTTHKPSATIKSLLCNTLKDKVHHMDKSNTIYKFSCGKCEKVYIGETKRSLRYRAHEHAVIPRRDSRKAHSLINEEERTESNTTNSDRPRRRGTTDISKHLAECPHRDEDYNFELIGTEPIWRRRVMKESLYLHRETKGTLLNQNMGKHRFGPIYNRLLGQPPTTQLQPISTFNPNSRVESMTPQLPHTSRSMEPIIDVNQTTTAVGEIDSQME